MKLTKTFNYLFVCAIIATLFTGCAKDGATGPAGANGANGATGATGPGGPVLTGSLYGYVKLYDEYGSLITTGVNATTVNIAGGSTNITVTTDSTGKYTFNPLTTGTYTISVSDSTYGSTIISGVQFVGGNLPRAVINLSKIPAFNVTGITFVDTILNITDSSIEINGTVNAANPQASNAIIYVGSSASTSSSPVNYLSFYTVNIKANNATFKTSIPLSDLYDLGFTPGQTVYFAAYGIASNFNNSSAYIDFTTGKSVFTAISTTMAMGNHIIP